MIAIIGAGPAGLAAAVAAARSGAEVALFDASTNFGGQYWRHRTDVAGYKAERAQKYFDAVISSPNITFISEAQVWSAERRDGLIQINYLQGGAESFLTVEKVILATGAHDRTLPFPGWDYPGSMTPGAAQALYKGHGVVAGKRILIAGSGPFLLPVATGLAEAGAHVVGLLEANSPLRWARSPIALLRNPLKFFELIYYLRLLRRYSLKPQFGAAVVGYENGVAQIARVGSSLRAKGVDRREIACDVVAVGWGFQPDVSLGGILGCVEKVDRDGTVIFQVDSSQLSSQANIWIAGEATGIGGADLSITEGEIAGLAAAGSPIPSKLVRKRSAQRAFARALQKSYPVGDGWKEWITPETTICRCEEVSQAAILESIHELGAQDSRAAKLFTRAGMGLCQGRICSRNVAEIIAGARKCEVLPSERIAASNRPLASPISLGVLADGESAN